MRYGAEDVAKADPDIDRILDILDRLHEIARKANRHGHSLGGSGFYANKFSELGTQIVLKFKQLSSRLDNSEGESVKNVLAEIQQHLGCFLDPKTLPNVRGESNKLMRSLFKAVIEPALNPESVHVPTDGFFPLEIVRGTRGYIERVAEQACGSYDQGWYDAASVMSRRLLETLIIETFEAHKLDGKIKNPDGSFFYLRDLISKMLEEPTWNLGRNVKKALPELKDLGDQSAHSRRYLAKKGDLDKTKRDLRITIEELVHLSNLKR